MIDSFFPLRIQYQDNMEIVIVKTPAEIADARLFKVLDTLCIYKGIQSSNLPINHLGYPNV